MHDMVDSSLRDLQYLSLGRDYLYNRAAWFEPMVGCQGSPLYLGRCITCCHTGLVTANCQLPKSASIVAVISSEASHAITLLMLEPPTTSQSPHV